MYHAIILRSLYYVGGERFKRPELPVCKALSGEFSNAKATSSPTLFIRQRLETLKTVMTAH